MEWFAAMTYHGERVCISHNRCRPSYKFHCDKCPFWGLDKMVDICQTTYGVCVRTWNSCISIQISMKFAFWELIFNMAYVLSCNRLPPKRQQAITWTTVVQYRCRQLVSMGHSVLNKNIITLHRSVRCMQYEFVKDFCTFLCDTNWSM